MSIVHGVGDGGDVLSAAQQDHVTASVLCEESSRYSLNMVTSVDTL